MLDKIMGIYKITNKINGKSYIGQSVNIERRWWNHKSCNGSDDFPLYKAIKQYGKDNFTYEVLEECSKDKLSERELYYIHKFNTVEEGYNPTDITDNPFKHKEILTKAIQNMTIQHNTMEYKIKQSEITKNLWKNKDYREKVTNAINKVKGNIPKKKKEPKLKLKKHKRVRLSRINQVPMKVLANTDEWRKKKSNEIKEAWKRGRYSKEQSANNIKKFQDKFKSDAEYREMVIQKMRDNKPNSIAIDMLDIETGEKIMGFPKIMDGAKWIRENTKYIKADYATINKTCKNPKRTAYGYRWRYSEKEGD